MLPNQHNTHTFANIDFHTVSRTFRMLKCFGIGNPSRESPETEMAPCQTQPRRHSRAPPKAVQMLSRCKHKIAEGWNQSHKCNFGGTMGQKPSLECQLLPWKEAAAPKELKKKGLYHSNMVKKSMGIMSKIKKNKAYRSGKQQGILCLTKNSGSGWTRMMKSLFPAHAHLRCS